MMQRFLCVSTHLVFRVGNTVHCKNCGYLDEKDFYPSAIREGRRCCKRCTAVSRRHPVDPTTKLQRQLRRHVYAKGWRDLASAVSLKTVEDICVASGMRVDDVDHIVAPSPSEGSEAMHDVFQYTCVPKAAFTGEADLVAWCYARASQPVEVPTTEDANQLAALCWNAKITSGDEELPPRHLTVAWREAGNPDRVNRVSVAHGDKGDKWPAFSMQLMDRIMDPVHVYIADTTSCPGMDETTRSELYKRVLGWDKLTDLIILKVPFFNDEVLGILNHLQANWQRPSGAGTLHLGVRDQDYHATSAEGEPHWALFLLGDTFGGRHGVRDGSIYTQWYP
jgi:hypothetical protein